MTDPDIEDAIQCLSAVAEGCNIVRTRKIIGFRNTLYLYLRITWANLVQSISITRLRQIGLKTREKKERPRS